MARFAMMCVLAMVPRFSLAAEATVARGDGLTSAAEVAVGYRLMGRSFGPTDGSSFALNYIGAASGVGVDARLTLLELSSNVGLGVFGEGAFSVGLVTRYEGSQFESNSALVRGGLVVRFGTRAIEGGVTLGVNSQHFAMAAQGTDGATRPPIPDVGFLGPRATASLRLALNAHWSFQVLAGGAWALAQGELGAVLAPTRVLAADARIQLAVTLASHVQVRLSGDWSRYFIATSTHAAADQYVGGTVAIVFALE